MTHERQDAEFRGQAEENRRIWDANARWWDDRIGDGNDFQTLLIEFEAGFVVNGIEEPGFPEPEQRRAGVRWDDMPDIPPVMVVRMRLSQGGQRSASLDA